MIHRMPGLRLWIGINDRATDWVWRWENNDPAAFFNWEAGTKIFLKIVLSINVIINSASSD